MKKIFSIIFLLLQVIFVFESCSKKDTSYLRVSAEVVTLNTAGTAVPVTVESSSPWNLPNSERTDWIKVKRTETGVTVSAAKNTSTESREGTFVISNETMDITVKVVQDQQNTIIVESDTHVSLSEDNQQLTFKFKHNAPYTINVVSGGEWLSVSHGTKAMEDDQITISVSKNNTTFPRDGEINLTMEGANPTKVEVHQTGVEHSFSFTVDNVSKFMVPSIINNEWDATIKYGGKEFLYVDRMELMLSGRTTVELASHEIEIISFKETEGLDEIDFTTLY